MDDERGGQVRTPPSGGVGFAAAGALNVLVAVVFWLAVTDEYGFSGNGAISYHYEEWLWPSGTFLAVAVAAGLVSLWVRGWRRFGAGLILGAFLVGVLDLAWTFVYFVSQGS